MQDILDKVREVGDELYELLAWADVEDDAIEEDSCLDELEYAVLANWRQVRQLG